MSFKTATSSSSPAYVSSLISASSPSQADHEHDKETEEEKEVTMHLMKEEAGHPFCCFLCPRCPYPIHKLGKLALILIKKLKYLTFLFVVYQGDPWTDAGGVLAIH